MPPPCGVGSRWDERAFGLSGRPDHPPYPRLPLDGQHLVPHLQAADGFDPQRPLTAGAHHLVRAAARHRLTADQRARARIAALDLDPFRSGRMNELAGIPLPIVES